MQYQVDALWSEAIVTQQEGSLSLLVNCPADCTPENSLVRGTDIPIARVMLRVRASAESGHHTNVVSLTSDSMLNFGLFAIVEGGRAALIAGPADDATTVGELTLALPQPVGLFASPQAPPALASRPASLGPSAPASILVSLLASPDVSLTLSRPAAPR